MIKRLDEITLETISKFYQFYNPLDLIELPKTLIINLLKYLSVKHLENFDCYLTNIDTNQIWQQHLNVVWNSAQDFSNNESTFYKCRYFEQLFTNTRALDIDLSVKIGENTFIHILNLSLNLIEKYEIKRDRIEYTPIQLNKNEKEKWDIRWNIYIKRLTLAQNVWHMIRDNEEFMNKFLINVNTLVLAGYPQANDVAALRFVIKLLVEGHVTSLILKFPHKILLKTLSLIVKSANKSDVNITSDDIKFSKSGSISLKNQIIRYGNRSLLWRSLNRRNMNTRSYISPFNRITNIDTNRAMRQRVSIDFSLQNLTNHDDSDSETRYERANSVQYTQDEAVTSIFNCASQSFINTKPCTSIGSIAESKLFTIDEEPLQSNSKLIYAVPKNSNICFLKTLEIHSVHHKTNIDFLSSNLFEMNFIENISISYLNSYSQELEESLLKLIFADRLKILSLNSIRLSNGVSGFMQRILLNDEIDIKNLNTLKFDLVKSQNAETIKLLSVPCRKLYLKRLTWKETEFSYNQLKTLQIFIKNSEFLECLDLKAIRLSTYLAPCVNEIINSCKYLQELRIKQFSLNQLNEFDTILLLLEKNQLKILHIDSCEILRQHIEGKKFEKSLSLATNLQVLNLPNNSLNDEALYKICASFYKMYHCSLKSIDLSGNRLTSISIQKLCDTIKEIKVNGKCFITELKLNGNLCSINSLLEFKNCFKNIVFSF